MKYVVAATRPLPVALGLAHALVGAAVRDDAVHLAASVIAGNAVVLGASQCAGRVVEIDACAASHVPVFRRASSGTALYVGASMLHFALAMPRLDSLVGDTTPDTLINRNVRGFLRAMTYVGALAQYFGREWIAVDHRPAALLGCDLRDDGGALLEVFIPLDVPMALPTELCTASERAVDRWRGHAPMALGDRIARHGAIEAATRIADRVAQHHQRSLERVPPPDVRDAQRVTDPRDPAPHDFHLGPPMPCAVGYVEAAVGRGDAVWLGGDALVGRAALDVIARVLQHVSAEIATPAGLIGARVEDFARHSPRRAAGEARARATQSR